MSLQAVFPRGSNAVRLEIADLSDDQRALGFRVRAFRVKLLCVLIGGAVAMALATYALSSQYGGCACAGPPSPLFIFFVAIGFVGGLALVLFAIYQRYWGLDVDARRMQEDLKQAIDKLQATL